MLQLNHTALHRLKLHAMQAYPEECCGILMGKVHVDTKIVCDVIEVRNISEENRKRRYLISPEDYSRAEDRARKEGVDVLGMYHSHPDHPAEPSDFDLEHALPAFSYIIVAVEDRLPTKVTSWTLKEDRSGYDEETLEVLDGEFKHICQ